MYNELIVFLLVAQASLVALFLFMSYKKLCRFMDDNNNSRIVLDKKMDEMALSLNNFHTLISRNGGVLSANSSLHKSLSDLHLMLKKVDSAFTGCNGDKAKTDKSEHCAVNSESMSGFKPSSPFPSSPFPSSPLIPYSPVKLKNKPDEPMNLNSNLENADNKKNGGEISRHTKP